MLDFNDLKNETVKASLIALDEVIKNFPEEKICAFALYSDDGAMTVCPSINTSKHLEKSQAENHKYLLDFKFSTAEWKYEAVGASDLFNEICRKVSDEISKDEVDFHAFKRKLFETCGEALIVIKKKIENIKEIDKDILLLFAVSDSDITEEQIKLASLLNTRKNFAEFEGWIKSF